MDEERTPKGGASCGCGSVDEGRRRSVGLVIATGLAAVIPVGRRAAAAQEPSKVPPQAGDVLVFAKGDSKGKAVTTADLAEAGTLIEAWPMDPASETVRRRSRLNRVIVLRLDPASLQGKAAEEAVGEGVLAYSGFCTHAGCFIETYMADKEAIYCHCHNSMFNPREDGKVVQGPARLPLARLPLKLDGEQLVVADVFQGNVGIKQS